MGEDRRGGSATSATSADCVADYHNEDVAKLKEQNLAVGFGSGKAAADGEDDPQKVEVPTRRPRSGYADGARSGEGAVGGLGDGVA